MFTVEFWRNVFERSVKTAAQFAVGSGIAGATNVLELDWRIVLGAAGMGALLSVLTSLGTEALPAGNPGTASLAKSVIAVDPPVKIEGGKHAADELDRNDP